LSKEKERDGPHVLTIVVSKIYWQHLSDSLINLGKKAVQSQFLSTRNAGLSAEAWTWVGGRGALAWAWVADRQ